MKAALLLLPFSASAFVPTAKRSRTTSMAVMSEIPENDVSFSSAEEVEPMPEEAAKPKKPVMVMSQALPFFKCPPVLADSDLAGNAGFDPLGFSKSKEDLWHYREAEIKHARLAMLAAVGWPLSELFDRPIANFFGVPSVLDEADRAPSVLNGGLDRISPVWWGFCVGLTAAIELEGIDKARAGDPTYFPGNLKFDPLGLYPADEKGRQRMQLAEIKHGRLAMLAILGFVLQEYVTKLGVVDETPFFFLPFGGALERLDVA